MLQRGTRIALASILFAGLTAGSATAETYTKREYRNRDECYRAKIVPAIVQYNTQGIKVRDASESWSGNMYAAGSRVVKRYHDPVYIQTSEVIEEQHITLVPVKCR